MIIEHHILTSRNTHMLVDKEGMQALKNASISSKKSSVELDHLTLVWLGGVSIFVGSCPCDETKE